MFTTLIILASICILFYKYLTCNFDYWKKRNVIGPEPVILNGNFPSIWTQKVHQAYEFDKIYNDYKGQPFVGIYSIRTPKLYLLDPELIKKVLIQDFKKFQDNEFSEFIDKKSDPLLGRNPFILCGEEWKEKRAEITPAFTTSRIRALSTLMDDVCTNMTNYVRQQDDKTFDTKELTAKYTTDVVSNCVFALDAKSFEYEKPEIREMGRQFFQLTMKFFLYFATVSLFPVVKYFFKVSIVPKHVNKFFEDIVRNAVNHRKNNKIDRNDYLGHLIKLEGKKQFCEIDTASHAISFFADGFETSSLTMSYAIYDIAKNKGVQERLRKEILDLLAVSGEINYDNIAELPYLEQVLNESLRLHPVIAVMTKLCTETTELDAGNGKKVTIEKGTSVLIPYYSTHLDAEHYPEPLKFDPERFSPENGGVKAYKDKCIFYIFSDGPRMCLGMRFAMAQLKRGIVEIIKNFELSVNNKTIEPLEIDACQFMIMPKGGIWVDFKPIV